MKIFELVKQSSPPNMAPGSKVGPVGPGTIPSGSTPVPNTEQKPNTSNTPKTPQPTSIPHNAQSSVPPINQVGQEPAQPATIQNTQIGGPVPVAPNAQAQQTAQPVNNQDLATQMKQLLRRITAIQNNPANLPKNPNQPGVSGDSTMSAPQV
jgi:hypothetical protein